MLYDDGKFLYSHHATDPCSGRLVNAFDMVRLHRFEGLDDDAAPGTPWIRLPSYKAMCELATQDPQVANLIMSERWEQCKTDFQAAEIPSGGIGGAESGETTDDGSWLRPPIMDVDGQLKPIKSLKNYKAALEHCPDLRGKIRLNQFTGRISVEGDRHGIGRASQKSGRTVTRWHCEFTWSLTWAKSLIRMLGMLCLPVPMRTPITRSATTLTR